MLTLARSTVLAPILLVLMPAPSFSDVVFQSRPVAVSGDERRFFFDDDGFQGTPIGACRVKNVSVVILPGGKTFLKADIASQPNRVYKMKLTFFDSSGRKINEQWPYIRIFVNPIFTTYEPKNLAVVPSSVSRIATIRRNDDCVRP
jgi:hypothetical protein